MSQNDQSIKRKLYLAAVIIFAVAYSLYCFVILPAYVDVQNNIAYDETITPDLLNYLGTIVSLLAVASFYAIVVYGLRKFCLSEAKGFILVFVLATLYKYSTNLLMEWGRDGKIPREWLIDIIFLVGYCVLEVIPFTAILLIVNSIMNRHREKVKLCEKWGKPIAELYPFRSVFDKTNPLMCSAMVCAVTEMIVRLIMKAASDIMTIVSVNNVLIMVLDYLSVLVFSVLCYCVMLLVLSALNQKMRAFEGE